MNDLFIKSTPSTPEIDFKTNGKFVISGKAIPSNVSMLFEPVFKWLEKYDFNETVFSVKLEYFNTSTSKILYDLLLLLEQKHEKGKLNIKWYYEEGDEDVLDTGQYYESLMETPFEFFVMSEYETMNL